MTAWTQALSAALLHFVWQGSLVAILLSAALFAMRRRPAAWRYAASCAAMALLAALPLATTWILARPAAAAAGAKGASPAYFFAAAPLPVHSSAAISWLARLEGWALPIWAAGVLLLSLRLIWGARQVHGLRRRAEPVAGAMVEAVAQLARRMGIRRPVAVGLSPGAESPSVVGWIRPLILLPSATLLGLSPEQLEAVLAHELAHIRRWDYAVNLAQTLLETLLFYHPAVWWVSARMRHERELCCDDLAVAACGDALCYARALTRLERLRLAAPGMAMASTGGPLLYRIQRLMGVAGPRYRTSRLPAILTLCLGLVCLGWNVRWAKAQEQQAQTQTQQREPATVTVTKDGQSMVVTLRNGVKVRPDQAQPVDFWMAADQGRTATFTFNPREGEARDRGIQVDTAGATVVKREPVEYPGSAIERNIQGIVTVEAIQDANGDVTDAHVLAGPQELRKAALHSVLEWRFQPAAAGTARQVNITFQIPPGGFPKEPEERAVLLRGQSAEMARKIELDSSQKTVSLLEKQLAEFRTQHQGELPQGSSPEMEAQYVKLRRELEQARRGVNESKIALGRVGEDNLDRVYGRTVKSINFRGMGEVSQELGTRLPVQVGVTMTPALAEQLEAAARQIDERMVVGYSLIEGNQVEIRLVKVGGDGEPGQPIRK